jgi:hypothetical protein
VLQKLKGVKMENIILARGDYVDLINGQVIGLGRAETTETKTYYGRKA